VLQDVELLGEEAMIEVLEGRATHPRRARHQVGHQLSDSNAFSITLSFSVPAFNLLERRAVRRQRRTSQLSPTCKRRPCPRAVGMGGTARQRTGT
jgi:hypothetical protein